MVPLPSLPLVSKACYRAFFTIVNVVTNTFFGKSGSRARTVVEAYQTVFQCFRPESVAEALFIEKEVVGNKSANGVVKIFEVDNFGSEKSTIAVKTKRLTTKSTDSLSYEFYIGQTLNRLRFESKTPCFDVSIERWYDNASEKVRCNLAMEYITHVDQDKFGQKAVTLGRFLQDAQMFDAETHHDVWCVLVLMMDALHQAQEMFEFTHYDLHMENVLVVHVPQTSYNLRSQPHVKISTRVIPVIIDFGRCHVKEATSQHSYYSDREGTMPVDKITWDAFTHWTWDDKFFYTDDSTKIVLGDGKEITLVDSVKSHVQKLVQEYRGKADTRDSVLHEQERRGTVDMADIVQGRSDAEAEAALFRMFYAPGRVSRNIDLVDSGIDVFKFKPMYDVIRIVMQLCSVIKRKKWSNVDSERQNGFWGVLYTTLKTDYPFTVPYFMYCPKEELVKNATIKGPADVLRYCLEKGAQTEAGHRRTQRGSGRQRSVSLPGYSMFNESFAPPSGKPIAIPAQGRVNVIRGGQPKLLPNNEGYVTNVWQLVYASSIN